MVILPKFPSSGSYCSHGKKSECTLGNYCPEESSLEIPCPAGSYCPNTSSQIACMAGKYCPIRSTEAIDCPDDATCVVPALPELVILPAANLNWRESEMDNGMVSYELFLSAKPLDVVQVSVAITRDESTKSPCHKHTRSSKLVNKIFTFEPQDYNVSQIVEIQIQQNLSFVEGNHFFDLKHTIQSNDPYWNRAFLRQVSGILLFI